MTMYKPTKPQIRMLHLLFEKGPQPANTLAMHTRKALIERSFIEFIENEDDSLTPLIGLTPNVGAPWCAGFSEAGGWR